MGHLNYARFISFLKDPDNGLDAITDKGQVVKMSEQYANTGFKIIADYVDNKKPEYELTLTSLTTSRIERLCFL